MTEPRKPGRGYIALARGALNHPLTGAEKPYSRFEAWVWMLDRARYEPGRVRVSGGNVYQTIALERGQFSDSIRYLADAWGWHKNRVTTFLRQLENDAQIRTATGTAQTVITICNYEEYQSATKRNGTAVDPATGTAAGQQRDKEKPRNQGTKEKKDISAVADATRTLDSLFEDFWKVKPNRGKAANPKTEAKKAYVAAINAGATAEAINAAAVVWAKRDADKVGTEFIPMARTWLKGRRFDDNKPDPAEAERARANEAAMIAKGWTLDPVRGWQAPPKSAPDAKSETAPPIGKLRPLVSPATPQPTIAPEPEDPPLLVALRRVNPNATLADLDAIPDADGGSFSSFQTCGQAAQRVA